MPESRKYAGMIITASTSQKAVKAEIHAETDGLDGIGSFNREMGSLVGFHQGQQDLEPVSLDRARFGLLVEVRRDVLMEVRIGLQRN